MMSLRLNRFFLVAIIALGLFTGQTDGAVRHNVSRHEPAFALSATAAELWGGVILQAEARFIDENGQTLRTEEIGISHFDKKTSKLYLTHNNQRFSFDINEDALDRIFSWVENKGEGLYTAHALNERQVREQGLTELASGDYVATEFASSRHLTDLAEYLDFFDDDLVDTPANEKDLLSRHNRGIRRADQAKDLDYVVSDLDSKFVVRFKDGKAEPGGTLYVYNRVESNDPQKVYVTDIQRFLFDTPENLKRCIDIGIPRRDAEIIVRRHLEALRLAQNAALLRTIFKNNRNSWDKFADGYFTEVINHK